MLANHGVLAVGGSFEQAYLRLELVEHLAKIALVAHQLGGPVSIPQDVVTALSSKGRPKSIPVFLETKAVTIEVKEAGSRADRPNLQSLISASQQKFS